MSYIYLASPYSDPLAKVREHRYRATLAATAWLINNRQWTYSPIVHCHALGLPTDAAFWQEYNFAMLDGAHELMILTLPGWFQSKGITAERAYAAAKPIPVSHLRPELCGANEESYHVP